MSRTMAHWQANMDAYAKQGVKLTLTAYFVAAIVQRSDPPRRLLSDVHVELHGDIAVTRGDLDIRYLDTRPDLFMRYVRVYRQFSSDWRAISHRTVYATDRKPHE